MGGSAGRNGKTDGGEDRTAGEHADILQLFYGRSQWRFYEKNCGIYPKAGTYFLKFSLPGI